MRIALCADGRSPHTERWTRGLVDRGIHVSLVWEPDQVDAQRRDLYPASVEHVVAPSTARVRPWTEPARSRASRALGQRLRPDLVHGLYLLRHGWAAAALGRRPLVLTAMGSDAMWLTSPPPAGTLRRRVAQSYERRVSRSALERTDLMLSDSHGIAERLGEILPGLRQEIVRFGVDEATARPEARGRWRDQLQIPEDALVVLSSRLLRPSYNIDAIVRSFPAVLSELPQAILVVKEYEPLTDAPYRELCDRLAGELGIAHAVRRVGELERSDLLDLYAAADVYVSVPDSDGTSVSVLEAMHQGTAVVASDVPGIDRSVLRDGVSVMLVPPKEAAALALALIRLGRDEAERRRLADAGVEIAAREGDFDRELDRAVLLYRDLLANPRRRL
jgi:glycosyltransferase involved in cell wall biosynthesis